jgi:esterase/lipase
MQVLKRPWVWLAAVIPVSLVVLDLPWNISALTSHTASLQDYSQAAARIQTLHDDEQGRLNPDCLVRFMTHGQKVQRAIVFVHGYTNCPMQFQALGQRFYDAGYNVLIAPLPRHGLANRLTDEPSLLTAEELAAYADEMVDIAHGLGEQVVMAGISGGGVTTAWAAQNRHDLDLAVIISPAFGFKQIPTALTVPVMNLISLLPESYEWWDPTQQANLGPTYSYPRYSRHGLAQIARLGFAVRAEARRSPPAAHRLLVILNGNEPSVNNDLTQQVVGNWRTQGASLTVYEFPANLGLPHDLIDPSQPDQKIEIVYPKLIELITR